MSTLCARWIGVLLACLIVPAGCQRPSGPVAGPAPGPGPAPITPEIVTPPTPDWTVLVFLNADNNLEKDSLTDFREMAKVGSSDRVNIAVQYDRIGKFAVTSPQWTQTLRFLVKKDMEPIPVYAVADIGEANMGDVQTLREFVQWGKQTYPAKHYALIIWDHGQGYRAMNRAASQPATLPSATLPAVPPAAAAAAAATQPVVLTNGYSTHRSISTDDTNGHDKLYNAEVVDALAGNTVDLIGFDACLMGMVETAYALRERAQVMVGSEELEPGSGYQYDDWLKELVARPSMDAGELGKVLVRSYERRYTQSNRAMPDTTLSCVDLSKAASLAEAVSDFSDELVRQLPAEGAAIIAARKDCRVYAPDPFNDGRDYFFHIDLHRFCERVEARCMGAELRNRAARVRAGLQAAVTANYAGELRRDEFGSNGLAIYFPATGTDYRNDGYAENGYEKDNQLFPVAFVRDHRWEKFLHEYFTVSP